MILARLSKHVKDQNWFAVSLDFVIVVVGVGVALIAQQWLSDRAQRADLAKAEFGLTLDIFNILYNAEERLALAACRRQRMHELVELLQASGRDWVGTTQKMENWYRTEFQPVITTARRNWGATVWEAELQRGTFNRIDDERRWRLGSLFNYADRDDETSKQVYELEAQLNVLGLSRAISLSERTRYIELLAQHDGLTSLLDLNARKLIESIETVGIPRDHQIWADLRQRVIDFNINGPARWGDCFVPVSSEILDIVVDEEAAP